MRTSDRQPFDTKIGNTLVEVMVGLSAVRHLRAGLMNLACELIQHPDQRGMLVLAASRISAERLNTERELASRAFRGEISGRLSLVLSENGEFPHLPPEFTPEMRKELEEVVRSKVATGSERLPRANHAYEIFKILVYKWLSGSESITIKELESMAGCTYPTVAKILEEMDGDLRRSSSRGVELAAFPLQRWGGYLAQADAVRQTFRFADRSGKPRAADRLIWRMARLNRRDLALGGVLGARGHFPELDLLGLPRMDLTVHCPNDRIDLKFVERIDPGLKLCAGREEPAALVIHVLRRKESFFRPGTEALPWADPVECLLDLHEARLEGQAQQFLTFLTEHLKNL